ncbi:MAG TPA: hypothetical protein VE544_08730 [Nitrososphaeraceae archaeon]|nr:hypothetical protein [Nitrososphaeraceae archaeon]
MSSVVSQLLEESKRGIRKNSQASKKPLMLAIFIIIIIIIPAAVL